MVVLGYLLFFVFLFHPGFFLFRPLSFCFPFISFVLLQRLGQRFAPATTDWLPVLETVHATPPQLIELDQENLAVASPIESQPSGRYQVRATLGKANTAVILVADLGLPILLGHGQTVLVDVGHWESPPKARLESSFYSTVLSPLSLPPPTALPESCRRPAPSRPAWRTL